MLEKLHTDSEDTRTIKNVYRSQIVAARVNNNTGQYQKIKWRVRQRCVLSPDAFSLNTESLTKDTK